MKKKKKKNILQTLFLLIALADEKELNAIYQYVKNSNKKKFCKG